jgi:hypothetical protein
MIYRRSLDTNAYVYGFSTDIARKLAYPFFNEFTTLMPGASMTNCSMVPTAKPIECLICLRHPITGLNWIERACQQLTPGVFGNKAKNNKSKMLRNKISTESSRDSPMYIAV